MRVRGLAALHVPLALCMLGGCESAAEKCEKARNAGFEGWAAYVTALEGERSAATAIQSTVHKQLTSVVEPRLMPQAQKLADARYPRSSEAWLRATKVAFNELCDQDGECKGARDQSRDANAALEDLAERLPPAIAARDATRGAVERAQAASEAAIIDPGRPQLKAAQALTATLVERCKDVPLEGAAKGAP